MFGDYKIIAKCSTTNARVSEFELSKNTINLPVFMPVATYGAMRGVERELLKEEIILGNTYHLRNLGRNIKELMKWERAMLTDSGGFQIQSLPDVEVSDEGVRFGGKLFTPEDSMDAQVTLGGDIMMQLDDVVNPKERRELHVVAVRRSLDWLKRAIEHLEKSDSEALSKKQRKEGWIIRPRNNQILFPIIQGGLDEELRKQSIEGILECKPVGIAIGGLSGGEDKNEFCSTVHFCCSSLPEEMPRYLMGVGYPEDVVVCYALGVDMSDCVYPTRTARFGRGFRDEGDILIGNRTLYDLDPISKDCGCQTCERYTRAYLGMIKGTPNFCTLMSVHNLYYMRNLTQRVRESIIEDKYPQFLQEFMLKRYQSSIPQWIVSALKRVNVDVSRAA